MIKPPLDLHAELVAPDGTRVPWRSESRDPGSRPMDISFASKRFEGWERGSARLMRPVNRDYPDLGLFDGFSLIGYDGSVAYEGMLGQIPRSTPIGIGVETIGWMAHAKHKRFTGLYIDHDITRWEEPTGARRLALASGSTTLGSHSVVADPAGAAALVLAMHGGWANSNGFRSEALYRAPKGSSVARVAFSWETNSVINVGTSNWLMQAYSTDDGTNFFDGSADQLTGVASTGSLTYVPTTPRRAAMLQLGFTTGPAGSDGFDYEFMVRQLRATGDHSVPLYGPAGVTEGYYASDLIADICAAHCPKLNTRGVQGTTWPVSQAVWHERIYPYDAWLELNKYHLWELAVWEDRTLTYGPSDLTDYTWQVKTTDKGVEIDLQGDSTDHLANHAVVEFTNVFTGLVESIGPDEYPELRDDSAENPANKHGLDVELPVTLTDPVPPDDAAQIGRVKLAENNQPAAIGTIRFKGHIRDRAGNWHQGWKVRAGQTIAIPDHPNNRARLIGEMQWDHTSKVGTIAVDSTIQRADAYLDRTSTALKAAGFGG